MPLFTLPNPETGERPLPIFTASPTDRLSLSFPARLNLAACAAFGTGLCLGYTHGSRTAALRFRAENAHRLPETNTAWYMYHKSKSYYAGTAGVKEGIARGAALAVWVGLFFGVENAVDRVRRGRRDAASSVVAGLSTAGIWSLWNEFPPATAARTLKLGFAVGLGYGVLQDLITLAKGRPVGYVELIKSLPARWRKAEEAEGGVQAT